MKRFLLEWQVLVFFLFLLPINLWPQTFTDSGISLPGVLRCSVAWGDYDNDGDLDILLSGSLITKIYKNIGDNAFTEQSNISLVGVYSGSAAWGDYDNDGDLDILLTGYSGSAAISKIYRNNGDNTFTDQTDISLLGVWYSSVAWGDYDNDGDLDILLTGSYNSKIYRNNGDNTFTDQTSVYLIGVNNSSVAWGDYDNDSDLDILITGRNSSNQSISKIYRNDGNNSFVEQTSITLTGVYFSSVAWADYDNDGNLDILLTGFTGSTAISKIYHNNGDNTFTDQTNISLLGVYNSSVAWGDYDNDGYLDILLTGSPGSTKECKIYHNNKDNTFTELTGISLIGVSRGSVAWSDYDNDGDLDILVAGENSSYTSISKVYNNSINIPNNKTAPPSNLQTSINDDTVTFTWDRPLDIETPIDGLSYNLYIYREGQSDYVCPPHAFRQTDERNGRRLIAKLGAIQWNPAGYFIKGLLPQGTYCWTLQAIDAGLQGSNFSSEQYIKFDRPGIQADSISFSNIQASQVTATWTNGDGMKRAVFIKATSSGTADPVDSTTYTINDITPNSWKCIYNGTGNSIEITGLVPNTDYLVHVCEYNGEAGSEKYLRSAVYQNPVYINTIFSEQTNIILSGTRDGSAAWGDYDNDSYLDILLTGSGYSKIYHNNGDGTFTQQVGISLKTVTESSVAWGDYDNDGDLDILLTGRTSLIGNVSKIYSNDGFNFVEQTTIQLEGVNNSSVAWGDYDNDGDLDILLTGRNNSNQAVSKIYRNNGNNSFTEQPDIVLTGVYNSSVAWGDYDNDRNLDFLLTGQSNSGPISKVYHNNGNNSFEEQTGIMLTGVYYSSVAWGDYNDDGYLDVLLTGANSLHQGVTKIYLNDGNNSFEEQTDILLTGVYYGSVGWGDYDNDGYLDILLAGRSSSGQVSKIYHNNGDNTFSEQSRLSLAGVYSSSVAWGDYDDDGDLDIFLTGINDDSGDIIQTISKIYKNNILIQNSIPSTPEGLESSWNENSLTFKWNKSHDDISPVKSLRYNLRIGTSPGGNEIRSSQALPSGKLLLTNLNNLFNDTCFVLKLPFSKYYWSVQAVDNGNMSGSFAQEAITPLDSIQAKELQAFVKSNNSLIIRWENGNGLRRALFGRLSAPSGEAKPVNGTIYYAEPYFGLGDQIEASGWYCMYNGKADSVTVYGLAEGYSYDMQVIEYIEVNGFPIYFSTKGNGNPGVFGTSLFSEQTNIILENLSDGTSAWGDYNDDGYLDILLTGANSHGQGVTKIYLNDGNNSFEEQTDILLTGVYNGSVAWGDYDSDNDLDILLTGQTAGIGPIISTVFRNDGSNTFTEQTGISLTGVFSSSVVWADYDNDGDLDIILTGYSSLDSPWDPVARIFSNNGEGSFSEQAGISLTGVASRSSLFGDYDNDGDLDILLAGSNYCRIYRNNGNNTFTEQTNISFTTQGTVKSTTWGDYDNDGDLDILLTGYYISTYFSKIYRNNGDNSFSEQTGISLITDFFTKLVSWSDCDNDGCLDILIAGENSSRIYHNNGNNTFTELTGIAITGTTYGSIAWGDYDNDGDLDLLIGPKIYRNNTIMIAGNFLANKVPVAPKDLMAVPNPDGIKLSWSPVRTDETSYKAMSYNVKIGTILGGFNTMSPNSNPVSGFRQLVNMGNAQLDTIFFIKSLSSGKYYWQVQAVDQGYMGGAWSAVDSFEVRNVQTFYSATEVCLGYPTTFTDQSVATDGIAAWKWDFRDGTTSSDQNPVHVYSASGTYNVKLVIADINGVKDSLEQNVIVKQKPLADFSAPDVCQGIPITVTNSTTNNGLTVSSWKWDFGDGGTSADQQPPPHPYLTVGNYNIKLKATASNGCADSVTHVASVGAYPIAAVTANAPLTFCKGDSVTLSVPYDTTYAYDWMIENISLTGANTYNYIVKQTGNYSVKIINPKGNCTTKSSEVCITAKEPPTAPYISAGGTTTFCEGDSVELSVTNTLNYTYQWKKDGGLVGTGDKYSAKSSGGYSLTVKNTEGCYAEATDTVEVVVMDSPSAGNISLSGPATFCQGGSVTLSVPATTGYSYIWKNEYGEITGATTNSYAAAATGTYKLEVMNSSGCGAETAPVTITVKATPDKPAITSTNYTEGICPGVNPITLRANSTVPGYRYMWIRNGELQYTDTLSYFEFYEQGIYKLRAALGDCTSESDAFNIVLPEAPDKPVMYVKGPVVWYMAANTKSAKYFKWYRDGDLIQGANKYIYVANKTLGTYKVAVGNENGCYTMSDPRTIPLSKSEMTNFHIPKELLVKGEGDIEGSIQLYPNPTQGVFTIEIDNDILGALNIDIVTEHGKEIRNIKTEKTSRLYSTEIDLSNQPKGIYFINLRLGKYTAARKVIIE